MRWTGRPPIAAHEDSPFPIVDDLEEDVAPPLHGKVHPPDEMDEAVPTLDDELRNLHHHPNEAGSVEFAYDPDAADAAADLAADLGAEYLEGATRAEDVSDLRYTHDEQESSPELPFLILEEETERVIGEGSRFEPAGGEETPETAVGDAEESAIRKELRRKAGR